MEYKLSEKAIHLINNHPTLKGELLAFNKRNDTRTIRLWLMENNLNGPLTSKGNIEFLCERLGLKENILLIQCSKEGEPLPYPVEMNKPDLTSDK